MKKSLRNLLKKKTQEPRQEKELIGQYNQLALKVGQIINQKRMFDKDLEQLYKQMDSINAEAGARQQLDRDAAKEAAPVTPTAEAK